jgi:hypothetical protein
MVLSYYGLQITIACCWPRPKVEKYNSETAHTESKLQNAGCNNCIIQSAIAYSQAVLVKQSFTALCPRNNVAAIKFCWFTLALGVLRSPADDFRQLVRSCPAVPRLHCLALGHLTWVSFVCCSPACYSHGARIFSGAKNSTMEYILCFEKKNRNSYRISAYRILNQYMCRHLQAFTAHAGQHVCIRTKS